MEKIFRTPTLSQSVYDRITSLIGEMDPEQNRLPSEEALSETLGVSRATVREALKNLALNHLTTTIHGKGTFAHPSALKAQNRLDIGSDFITMLRKQHQKVTIHEKWEEHAPLSDYADRTLQGEERDAIASRWIYIADEQRMMYGRYHLLHKYIIRKPDLTRRYLSLPEFSGYYMQSVIDYCTMYCRIKTDAEAASALALPDGTPLLCWEEDIYDIDDHMVGAGEVFVHPDNMTFSIVTKLEV